MRNRPPRAWIAGALVAGLLACAWPWTATAQASLEYGVKANYLVRFAAFVEWPPQAFANARTPISVCVVGRDPFAGALSQAAAAQRAHGRPVQASTRTQAQGIDGCHIVYLGAGSDPADMAAARPILWVTDGAVTNRRGIIHFVIERSRVRFHIDQRQAMQRRLAISSRLLDLALTVQANVR